MRMVALDLDGTLVDQEAAATRWAEEFVSAHRLSLDVDEVACLLTARRPKGAVFAELVQVYELSLDADEVWAAYRRQMPYLVSCADTDRAALGDLRQAGWKIGIVTNGLVDNQEGKIRQLGLDALVDGWVISAEVGVRKPARGIFEILASRLACPLNGWMVGDSVEMDVIGGRSAGLRTALIAGDGSPGVAGSADLVASSVAEAAALILAESS